MWNPSPYPITISASSKRQDNTHKFISMPIEIKELHIKAVVGEKERSGPPSIKPEDIARLKKEIVKEVTEKIVKLLHQKNER